MAKYEKWYKYNDKGNCISEKDSTGLETVYVYDEDDNLSLISSSNGYKEFYSYEDGKLIRTKDSDGLTTWYEYDEIGRLKTVKDNEEGFKFTYVYDELGRLGSVIRSKLAENGVFIMDASTLYDYNDNGDCIHIKSTDGREQWFEVDEEGFVKESKETYFISDLEGSATIIKHFEFDEKENTVNIRCDNGDSEIRKFDDDGNLIYELINSNFVIKNS